MAKKMYGHQLEDYTSQLSGSDLRSIAGSNDIVAIVNSQEKFNGLFTGLYHPDRKIVMRTADAIEKITQKNSLFLQPHKTQILELAGKADHIELKWHLAQLLPRLDLTEPEFTTAWKCLAKWAGNTNESKIVRANSIEGLFHLLQIRKEMKQVFNKMVMKIINENIPSLNARIKKLTKTYS